MVVTVSAVDGDETNPNHVVYSLVSGNEDGYFLLDHLGQVRVASDIDRDQRGFRGEFFLTVRATEVLSSGGNQRGRSTSEIGFRVDVEDVNDERAQFDEANYSVRVTESTPAGTLLDVVMVVHGRKDEAVSHPC